MTDAAARHLAAEAIVGLAAGASGAPWTPEVTARLQALVHESSDQHAGLVLECHLDGSARVDVSVYGWPPDAPSEACLGTEFDCLDAVLEMGVFFHARQGSPHEVVDGLPPPVILGMSARHPGLTRCIIPLRTPSDLDTARAATHAFAALPWKGLAAWLSDGATMRLSVDIDEAGVLVPGQAGVELFDDWDTERRLTALRACRLPEGCIARAEALWRGLPRMHEVTISPDVLPGLRLVLGKAQARRAHAKVNSSPSTGLGLKAYVLSQWIDARTHDDGVAHVTARNH